jgi:Ca-activated chloride channel homolog
MFDQFELAPAGRVWVHLLWLVPGVLLLGAWGIARRQATLKSFGLDAARSAAWLASLRGRRWRKAICLALAIVFLTAAALQPRCNPERTRVKTAARDIAVLLDVSRSMLADDLKPNRLERAKIELKRLCDHLKGDRVGLVVFAGDAVIKSPLTSDYSYFKEVLGTIDHRSAASGGTRIGDAIRKALGDLLGLQARAPTEEEEEAGVKAGETVIEEERRARPESFADILLITDGEDMDSYPLYAARAAAEANVGIYAVGLGSKEGSTIPVSGEGGRVEFLRSPDGELVRSKLDSKTLEDMVNASPRGQYLPVGTYNFDLVSFYEKTISREEGRELYEEQVLWTEVFQPLLLAGIAFYVASLLVSERPRRGQLEIGGSTS